jgi:SAM-dependent methyltransferase
VHDEGDVGHDASVTQYATDANLAARQALWAVSDPPFELVPWVLDLAGVGRTVDIGCGNGSYLVERPDAVGMDLSPGMLHAARDRGVTSPLVCGNAEALPFADGALDVVLAPHMLYHVDDRVAAVHELRRILRSGGVCVVVTNGPDSHAEMRDMMEDVIGRGWRWRRPSDVVFGLGNGEEQLRVAFDHVERVDTPPRHMIVDDADAYAAYVASVRDIYEQQVHDWITWDDVVDECRRRCADTIERHGVFRVSTEVGAFVCR